MSEKILSEAKRLHALGLAIHWLRPKSKIPVKSGWSGDSKDSLKILQQEFKSNYNIGTKLGKPSLISTPFGDEGYLAVIDVDVKGSTSKHQKTALAKIEEMFPGLLATAPITLSGRGNGSMHIWCLVDSPLESRALYASNEMVEVMMPSAKPTHQQIEVLGEKKVALGWRLRPAFEIDFMCDGRQVVLPPSIHPDTGKRYQWKNPINDSTDIPFVDMLERFENIKTNKKSRVGRPEGGSVAMVKPVDVDELDLEMRLKPDVVTAIIEGEGVADRSAMCLSIAMHMVRAQFTDEEIVGVLTNRKFFIGDVAFEHAKTSNRMKAARWVERYCLEKAKAETSGVKDFESEVEIYETLSPEKAKEQKKRLVKDKKDIDWRLALDRTKEDKLKPTFKNVRMILENQIGSNVFIYDTFSLRQTYGMNTKWGGVKGVDVTDLDEIKIKNWLANEWKIEPPVNLIGEVISQICTSNAYHPVQQYLETLEWDGVPRIDTWMQTYLGATGNELYLQAVSRKFLCAAVARVYNPGIKFDHMPIFEGMQGIGKSTVGRILASDKWFYDSDLDLRDKDSALNLQGQWVVEMGELANINRADVRQIKSFIVRQVDKVRPPYGKRMVESPRQCVFFGTTNDDSYLKDKTGNRRFWPVKVGDVDLVGLREDRDQLWAEALFAFDMGEPLWLPKEIEDLAKEVQESRVVEDVSDIMVGNVENWWREIKKKRSELRKKSNEKIGVFKFKLTDLFGDFSGFDGVDGVTPPFKDFRQDNNSHLQMAAFSLKKIGFEKYKTKTGNMWKWGKKE